MTAPEPLAEQIARHNAHRRHVRRSRRLLALLVVLLAVAGVVWPDLLRGLMWLTAYCVVIAALWFVANRLVAGRRRPLPPAVPEPETHVRIVADVVTDRDVPNDD